MNAHHDSPLHRWLGVSTAVLLTVAFAAGGGSQARTLGDTVMQLLALPVLLMVCALAMHAPLAKRAALVASGLVFAGVAIQLLPLPTWADLSSGTRSPIREGLALAGVGEGDLRISLTPWATERGMWALLPALGAFGAALLLPMRRTVQLSWLLVGLAAASLILGYLQLGAPQDSPLNPFPQWRPALGGVFANPNHQGTALTIALVVVLSWLLGNLAGENDAQRTYRGVPLTWRRVGATFLSAFFLVAIPLTGSRAMVLIAAGALLMVPLTSGWVQARIFSRRRRRVGLLVLGSGAVIAAMLLVAVSSWVRVDSEREVRGAVAQATANMARDATPLGTGVGSFVPWFDAHIPDPLLQSTYFNHAHNEYVQWWLESGVPGLIWIALLLGAVVWAFPREMLRWRRARDVPPAARKGQSDQWLAGAAWLSVAVLLAHSLADYPLHTPALMAVGAWFAGVMVAVALRSETIVHRDFETSVVI